MDLVVVVWRPIRHVIDFPSAASSKLTGGTISFTATHTETDTSKQTKTLDQMCLAVGTVSTVTNIVFVGNQGLRY